MNSEEKAKLRTHYESRSNRAFPNEFTPDSTILAYDVGYALMEKHFDRPPIGYDEIFGMVEELLTDLRPDDDVEKALTGISCIVNVLGTMIAIGLLRRGLRPTWVTDEKSGKIELQIQRVDWDPEGPFLKADPMQAIRDAFLEGPSGKLTAWRDQVFASLDGLRISEPAPGTEDPEGPA